MTDWHESETRDIRTVRNCDWHTFAYLGRDAAAKSSADHEAIAQAYESEAASLEKMAAMHRNLGDTYGSQAGGKALHTTQARHCLSVAKDLDAAAKEERALAAEHRRLAKSAGK